MSGVEWLGSLALVALAVLGFAALAILLLAHFADDLRGSARSRADAVGGTLIAVAIVAALVAAGCGLLILLNLALGAMLSLAT